MSLRIWHQSFTVLQDIPGYSEALARRIKQVVRPDTEVVLHGQIPGTYSDDYPGSDIEYNFLFWLHGLQWIAAAREAQAQGYDAIVLATVPSPMIVQMRSLIDIPAVGYGDGAMNLAGLYGRRAGLMLFDTTRSESWPDTIHQWGLTERFCGVFESGVSFRDVLSGYTSPQKRDEVVGRIVASAERFVREKQVDVIVAGQMPMNLLLAEAGVTQIGGATVMDGIATCFKLAETMVDLQKVSGMKASRRGYYHAQPDPRRIDEALKFYGLQDLGKRIPEEKI